MYLFFLIILSLILVVFLIDSIHLGITPTPTSKKVRLKIMNALPKETEGDIYELGSGFGHMTFDLSKKFYQNSIKSYEKAKIPFIIQKLLLFCKKEKNIALFFKDFKKEDLSTATIVFCYLYRKVMPILAVKLEEELKSGAYVVSHTFAIEKWNPIQTLYANDIYKTPIYIYQMGSSKLNLTQSI